MRKTSKSPETLADQVTMLERAGDLARAMDVCRKALPGLPPAEAGTTEELRWRVWFGSALDRLRKEERRTRVNSEHTVATETVDRVWLTGRVKFLAEAYGGVGPLAVRWREQVMLLLDAIHEPEKVSAKAAARLAGLCETTPNPGLPPIVETAPEPENPPVVITPASAGIACSHCGEARVDMLVHRGGKPNRICKACAAKMFRAARGNAQAPNGKRQAKPKPPVAKVASAPDWRVMAMSEALDAIVTAVEESTLENFHERLARAIGHAEGIREMCLRQ